MPLTVQDGALVGAGMLFAGGATIFYRRKQTLPFKVGQDARWTGKVSAYSKNTKIPSTYHGVLQLAYFAAWPTLGTAVMLACIPRNDRLVAVRTLSLLSHSLTCICAASATQFIVCELMHALAQDMKRRGLVSEEQIQEAHKQSVIQMQHIQDAAKHPNVKAPASSGS